MNTELSNLNSLSPIKTYFFVDPAQNHAGTVNAKKVTIDYWLEFCYLIYLYFDFNVPQK